MKHEQAVKKKKYESPRLREYGNIRTLTQGGTMYIMWDNWMYKFFATS